MSTAIPASVERRARWVLDTIGARDLGVGDDVPYDAAAWERVERGEQPIGDDLAEAFFHLARLEEIGGRRDAHNRFRAAWSTLDPLDPPLERLRRKFALAPPRWRGARFAVALSHDVDFLWRWENGEPGRALRSVISDTRAGRFRDAARTARALRSVPLHKLRGTDPWWCFDRLIERERRRGARSTFYVMAGNGHPLDTQPEIYDLLRSRLVDTLRAHDAEIGLHGSYLSAEDETRLTKEKEVLQELAGPISGNRFHYLRVDPHHHFEQLAELGLNYDASLGFPDAIGFRAGIAHPFAPWDIEADRRLDFVAVPLAVHEVTLVSYMRLTARQAEARLLRLLDWAAERGGGFSILWHQNYVEEDWGQRLYLRVVDAIQERGGICLSVSELVEEAAPWLGLPHTDNADARH